MYIRQHIQLSKLHWLTLYALLLTTLVVSGCGSSTPPGTVPSAPAKAAATSVAGGVQIEWTDTSENETGFVLMRSVDDGPYAELGRADKDAETFTDAEVMPGSSYRYRVAARNAAGSSDYDETAAVSVEGGENESALELLSATSRGHTSVLATFDGALGDNATEPANYRLSSGLSVESVTLSKDRKKVTLTTTEQVADTYELSVENLQDAGGARVTTQASSFSSSAKGSEAPLYLVDAFSLDPAAEPAEATFAIEAGPIWGQSDANTTCRDLAADQAAVWTGHWWTTVSGQMSVCQVRVSHIVYTTLPVP